MSQSSFLKRRWKLLLNIATIVLLIALAVTTRKQVGQTFQDLFRVHASVLFLMIPLQLWNYQSQARSIESIFNILGEKLSYKYLYKLSLELNFVNSVFPSGGVSGASYFAARVKSQGISVVRSTFAYIMKFAFVFFAFEILVVLGILMLAIGGHVSGVAIFAATLSSALIVFGTFLFAYIVGSSSRIKATIHYVTKFLNEIIHIFRRKHPATIDLAHIEGIFEDFHQNYKLLSSKFKDLGRPLFYGLTSNISELLTIYVVYLAFGHWVNPGAVILAYAIANFAGLISVLPSGIGTYEAIMVAVMVAAGVPAHLSLSVTIMYRVLNILLQLPPGYYFYHKALRIRHTDA